MIQFTYIRNNKFITKYLKLVKLANNIDELNNITFIILLGGYISNNINRSNINWYTSKTNSSRLISYLSECLFQNNTIDNAKHLNNINLDITDNISSILEPISCNNIVNDGTNILDDSHIVSYTFSNLCNKLECNNMMPTSIKSNDPFLLINNNIPSIAGIKLGNSSNNGIGWYCMKEDYVIIELDYIYTVVGIAIQGYYNSSVSSYTLFYSLDKINLSPSTNATWHNIT